MIGLSRTSRSTFHPATSSEPIPVHPQRSGATSVCPRKRLLIPVLLLIGCYHSPSRESFSAELRPNVLLIVSDDQGYPDLGCMGIKPIRTPSLDRLAAEGVRATSFYVTWPACTPSRGSLLTGRYPQRNGLYDMVRNDMVNYGHRFTQDEYAVSPEMTLGLDPRELTQGDLLRPGGYACGVVGKWDMGQAKRYLPLQRGFDYFYGHGNNGIDYFTHERYGIPSIFENNQRTQADRGRYATDLFGEKGVAFIEQHAGKRPFFLLMAFNAPHSASALAEDHDGKKPGVQAPADEIAKYDGVVPDPKLAGYYAAVTRMDRAIGDLLAAIDKAGQTDHTIVIFMSDNGGSGNGGNAPLRGAKSTMWEGGLRVPMLIRWPGKIPADKVTDEFLTSLEIMPTLLAATDSKVTQGLKLDGFDMLPVLQGKCPSPRDEMFWQRRSDKAARVGNWKWVESAKGKGLFDLSSDLGESHDMSREKPELLREMEGRFATWRKEMDAAEPRGPFQDY